MGTCDGRCYDRTGAVSVPQSPVLAPTIPQYVGGMVPVSRPRPGSTGAAGTRSAAAQPATSSQPPATSRRGQESFSHCSMVSRLLQYPSSRCTFLGYQYLIPVAYGLGSIPCTPVQLYFPRSLFSTGKGISALSEQSTAEHSE